MIEEIVKAVAVGIATPATLFGIARIIRETYDGRAKLIRARRGDPQPDARRPTLPRLPKTRSRAREG